MTTEQFANGASSTLDGALGASDSSLVVLSASSFPTQGQFRILVDTEIMLVTAVTGRTFTVNRGQEGTTATSHFLGATVTHILTAGALSQVKQDVLSSVYLVTQPNSPWYSPVDLASSGARTSVIDIGGYTVGIRFCPYWALGETLKIIGLRFYGKFGGAGRSVKCKLYNDTTNDLLASATVTGLSQEAVVSATFTTPYTFTATDMGKPFVLGIYELANIDGTYVNAPTTPPSTPYFASPWHTINSESIYHAGDAKPDTVAPPKFYPVEPIFSSVLGAQPSRVPYNAELGANVQGGTTYVTVLSQTVNVVGTNSALFLSCSMAGVKYSTGTLFLQLSVDGVPIAYGGGSFNGGFIWSLARTAYTTVTQGTHEVTLALRTDWDRWSISPNVSGGGPEHASLYIQEVGRS